MLWPSHMRAMYSCELLRPYLCTTRADASFHLEKHTLRNLLYEIMACFPSLDLLIYCCSGPFCQVSNAPTSLPQGLRDPPAYSPPASPRPPHATLLQPPNNDQPPSYSALDSRPHVCEKASSASEQEPAQDVLHFLDPSQDSLSSLSLRYGVPQDALRRTNGLYADHLLAARRTILIPGEFYKGGISLSPRPVEGEEEEIRKGKVRRWMVACKVVE